MTRRDLLRQIAQAKRNYRSWPKWMRDIAYFATTGKRNRSDSGTKCHATIPGNGFENVMFCTLPEGHEGAHQP